MLVRTRHPFDTRLNTTFDQLTRSFFTPTSPTTSATGPAVDARWHDGSLELNVDLPGTPGEAISVDIAGRQLTIAVDHDGRSWKRSVRLGAAVDPEQVSARYVHGRLTITVAAAASAEQRPIAIDTSPAPAIETSSDEPTQESDSDSSDNG